MSKFEPIRKGIHELYRKDPNLADKCLWDRQADPVTRRGFIKGSGLAAMASVVGAVIPFARFMPAGLIPVALADSTEEFKVVGKDGLIVLNDRPINAETPAHLLDDEVTPASRLFVRNNGIPPITEGIDPQNWAISVEGESCANPQTFTLGELQSRFKHYHYNLHIECGGNGRSEFNPPASGNQWSTGAIGCPRWTGVRLKDVLKVCGIKDDAVYVGYYGADLHLSRTPGKVPISRGVPMTKALENETLIAWALNDEPLPELNGYPIRLVCGGWPASTSGKWLNKIVIRNQIHDGPKMGGTSYRVPCKPIAPGTTVPEDEMCIIESMPIKSLVTFPKSGIVQPLNDTLTIRGSAWAGDLKVKQQYISIDFGATWIKAKLKKPANRLAWQRWSVDIEFPEAGYYEVWARAVDSRGTSQPMVLPGWNPKGYLNNACHRIAVKVV